jgi:ATP-dependent Clp protease ATP-binding subunit ClpA
VLERLNHPARQILVIAQDEARLLQRTVVGPDHILLGIIDATPNVAAQALEMLGISSKTIRAKLREEAGPRPRGFNQPLRLTPGARAVFELASQEALRLGHDYIGPEHLLLAIIDSSWDFATQIELLGDPKAVRAQVMVAMVDSRVVNEHNSKHSPRMRTRRQNIGDIAQNHIHHRSYRLRGPQWSHPINQGIRGIVRRIPLRASARRWIDGGLTEVIEGEMPIDD